MFLNNSPLPTHWEEQSHDFGGKMFFAPARAHPLSNRTLCVQTANLSWFAMDLVRYGGRSRTASKRHFEFVRRRLHPGSHLRALYLRQGRSYSANLLAQGVLDGQ